MLLGAESSARKTMKSYINTKGHDESLHAEQKERGITRHFLKLVTKDHPHEYLMQRQQMKRLKVWQVTSKLDEQKFPSIPGRRFQTAFFCGWNQKMAGSTTAGLRKNIYATKILQLTFMSCKHSEKRSKMQNEDHLTAWQQPLTHKVAPPPKRTLLLLVYFTLNGKIRHNAVLKKT